MPLMDFASKSLEELPKVHILYSKNCKSTSPAGDKAYISKLYQKESKIHLFTIFTASCYCYINQRRKRKMTRNSN
jgi:hypothetical protein